MADQERESGQELEESQAAPTPSISGVSGDEPASARTVDAEALAKSISAKVLADLDETLDRKLQSTKDKRLAALDGLDVASLKRFSALVKELGSEDKAIRELQVDRLLEQKASPVSDPGRSPTLESRSTEAILSQVKADYGVELAPNDPELVEAAKKTYSSWDAWDNTVNKIGARRLKQGAVSQTAVVAETQQKPPSGNTLDAALTNLKRVQGDQKARPADIQKAMTAYQEALARQR